MPTPGTTQGPAFGPAMTLGQDIYNKGQGLLSSPVAGNGFNRNMGQVAPNGYGQTFGQVAPNGVGQVQYQAPNVAARNPYLQQIAGNVRRQTNDFLGDALLGIQSQSVASGGLGGTRQGVAQGVAAGKAADALSGNLASMYGQAYEGDSNRSLQRYGLDINNYNQNRGMDLTQQGQNMQFFGQQRGQDLAQRGQNMDFWTGQRGQDLAQAGMGAGLIGQGLDTQWMPLKNATSVYAPFSGMGSTTTSQESGGGWQGALGGALGVLGLGGQMGWWGKKP